MYYQIRVPVPSIKLDGMAKAYEATKSKAESLQKSRAEAAKYKAVSAREKTEQPKLEFGKEDSG